MMKKKLAKHKLRRIAILLQMKRKINPVEIRFLNSKLI